MRSSPLATGACLAAITGGNRAYGANDTVIWIKKGGHFVQNTAGTPIVSRLAPATDTGDYGDI